MAKVAQELILKSKTFEQLALEGLESLTTGAKEGKGKSAYRDYSFVINRYFIPFLVFISNLNYTSASSRI